MDSFEKKLLIQYLVGEHFSVCVIFIGTGGCLTRKTTTPMIAHCFAKSLNFFLFSVALIERTQAARVEDCRSGIATPILSYTPTQFTLISTQRAFTHTHTHTHTQTHHSHYLNDMRNKCCCGCNRFHNILLILLFSPRGPVVSSECCHGGFSVRARPNARGLFILGIIPPLL